MALGKSTSEERGDTLLRVLTRGRASIREAAILLNKSWSTTKAHIDLGKIQSYRMGKRDYVSLPELVRNGLELPHLPKYSERIKQLLTGEDSNISDPGDYE